MQHFLGYSEGQWSAVIAYIFLDASLLMNHTNDNVVLVERIKSESHFGNEYFRLKS